MKWKILILILIICAACNDEVFVKRPGAEAPTPEEPTVPEPAEPIYTDSLVLLSLIYDEASLRIEDEELVSDAQTTFTNYTSTSGVAILFDNYNSSFVRFSNSTYYVTPWAKEGQPTVALPGINAEGVPGFYGTEFVFTPGYSVIHKQFMAGHAERFDLPPNSKVTATIYTVRKVVTARATMKYYVTQFPTITEDGWWNVSVAVPVKIYVEWGDVIPVK